MSSEDSLKRGRDWLAAKMSDDPLPDGCIMELPLLLQAVLDLHAKIPSTTYTLRNDRFSFHVKCVLTSFFFRVEYFDTEKRQFLDVPQLMGMLHGKSFSEALETLRRRLERIAGLEQVADENGDKYVGK